MHVRSLGEVLLLGDFNLKIQWSSSDTGVCNDFCDDYFFQHFILATLDYVVSSFYIERITIGRNIFCSDHLSLEFEIIPSMWPVLGRRDISTPPRAIPNWKKTHWEAVNRPLSLLPWCLLESDSIEESVSLFYE
ncbi:hypothetical protein J437_LFUL013379 [Ladona fulva]|uniref:Endonuclease/exonuclease/phosphatase domain-containing protein n=1 Tax=Ladona fulva TaxID=123851 RepID=A0A8K0KK79_LADFU|nr:hypothetical protein J437_LFUL013379 [Ladona fulva]